MLDPSARLHKQFLINRKVDGYYTSMSHGSIRSGDELKLLAIDGKGRNFTSLYGSIDLKNMQWMSLQHLKAGQQVLDSQLMLERSNTIWFPGSPVLHYLKARSAVGGSALVTELKVMKS